MAGIRESVLTCLETERSLWKQRKGTTEFLTSPEKQILDAYIEFIDMVSHDVRNFNCIYYFENNRYEEELCINPLWSPISLFSLIDKQLNVVKETDIVKIELQYLNKFFTIYKENCRRTVVLY